MLKIFNLNTLLTYTICYLHIIFSKLSCDCQYLPHKDIKSSTDSEKCMLFRGTVQFLQKIFSSYINSLLAELLACFANMIGVGSHAF